MGSGRAMSATPTCWARRVRHKYSELSQPMGTVKFRLGNTDRKKANTMTATRPTTTVAATRELNSGRHREGAPGFGSTLRRSSVLIRIESYPRARSVHRGRRSFQVPQPPEVLLHLV